MNEQTLDSRPVNSHALLNVVQCMGQLLTNTLQITRRRTGPHYSQTEIVLGVGPHMARTEAELN